MDGHWRNYCTLSIVHFMAFPECMGGGGPLLETVGEIASDAFFGGIEVGWIRDPGVRVAVRSLIEASHLKVVYAAQPSLLLQKLDLNSLVPAERQRAVDHLKECIDEAAQIGASRVAFLSGRDPGARDREAAFDALVQSTREACAYARQRGIGLTCEIFDREVDKKCLIGPSEYAAEFARVVREDFGEFGLMYDLSHQPLLFERSELALGLLKEYLVHVHVGNCVLDPSVPGYGDSHPRFGWPGGCNDVDELAAFIRALFKIRYLRRGGAERPWIGFEVKPQTPNETAQDLIAGTKRVWEEAWSRA